MSKKKNTPYDIGVSYGIESSHTFSISRLNPGNTISGLPLTARVGRLSIVYPGASITPYVSESLRDLKPKAQLIDTTLRNPSYSAARKRIGEFALSFVQMHNGKHLVCLKSNDSLPAGVQLAMTVCETHMMPTNPLVPLFEVSGEPALKAVYNHAVWISRVLPTEITLLGLPSVTRERIS